MRMKSLQSQTRRCEWLCVVCGLVAWLLAASASSQYAIDWEEEEREHREHGIRYFGAAKDEKGALIPNVTFLLESKNGNYVFVSNAEGRFRGYLPKNIPPGSVTPKCSKAGMEFVRATKRLGPKSAEQTVQVDCVMRNLAKAG
jgi:hypothetical protein